MSTFTVSKNLEQVARGADLGTWDTPENSNWAIVDAALGGTTTIPLNNSNVLLSSPQFQSNLITFNSTLTGSVVITFPSTFTGTYVIQNLCTGTSAFTITLQTTVAGGQVIGCKPGEGFDVFNDGTNLKFYNLDHVGRYWDYAGSSVPNWVSACTVPPYLNCDGTTFSSATYPTLASILGSTTLPDIRGVTRVTLNQGTSRVTSSNSGLNGNVAYTVGGLEVVTLLTSQIPSHTHTVVDPSHSHTFTLANANAVGNTLEAPGSNFVGTLGSQGTNGSVTGISNSNTGGGALHTNMQPTTISGICMVRSA